MKQLERCGMRPGRGLGQNFLLDRNLLEWIVRKAAPQKDENILEVGPGFGALTELLIATGAKVTAVEYDHRIAEHLRKRFANAENLRLVEKKAEKEKKPKPSHVRTNISHDFRDEIDLRGKTGDEAWFMVDKYFDTAILAGFHVVRLIHGKGTGMLRQALWRYLKNDKRIAHFRIGQFGEGDSGVTVVELK